jgi:hypothetical protein
MTMPRDRLGATIVLAGLVVDELDGEPETFAPRLRSTNFHPPFRLPKRIPPMTRRARLRRQQAAIENARHCRLRPIPN